MWKCIGTVVAVLAFLVAPASAYYDQYDDYEDSHPLRIAAYPVHAAGYAIQWLVTRPIHALVSQPELNPVFGHYSDDFGFDAELDRDLGQPELGYLRSQAAVVQPAPAAPAISSADLDALRQAADDAKAAAEAAQLAAAEAARAAEAAERAADKSTRAFDRSLMK